MINLAARVTMDTSGFARAMGQMSAAAKPAAMKIGDQMKHAMISGLGVFGVMSFFKSQIRQAAELRKGAGGAAVDTSTYQVLLKISEQTGESIEKMAEKLRDGSKEAEALADSVEQLRGKLEKTGSLIDEKTVADLARLNDQLQILAGRFAPIAAAIAGFVVKLYDWGTGGMQQMVGNYLRTYGFFTGSKDVQQIGNELYNEAGHPAENGESDIKKLGDEFRNALKVTKEDVAKEKAAKASSWNVDHSSLVQAGGLLSANSSSATVQPMNRLVDHVASIRRTIEIRARD